MNFTERISENPKMCATKVWMGLLASMQQPYPARSQSKKQKEQELQSSNIKHGIVYRKDSSQQLIQRN
jgi:hypothetical protein